MERLRTATRPVVTLLFSLAVVGGFFTDRLNSEQFYTLATAAISFWFASRGVGEKK